MKDRIALLLATFEGCSIGANSEEDELVSEGVDRPYVVIVERGRREGEIGCFGRETISAHDIGFFGVIGDAIGSYGVITGVVSDVHDVKGEGIGVINATDV